MTIDTTALEASIDDMEQQQLPAKTNGNGGSREITPVEQALAACSAPLDHLFDYFDRHLAELERKIKNTRDRVGTHRKNFNNRLHDLALLSNDLSELNITVNERLDDIEDAVKKVGA